MERQSIAQDTLLEILLSQTGKALGKDASYLGDRIEFIRREGAPNWDATIKIASPPDLKAFAAARKYAQGRYNLA